MLLFNLNLEATCFLWEQAKCKDHTMWEGGILKTEYVYTEFPPSSRWHSDIDPQGANTKTTLFSVSKKALTGIDDYHQQHQYLTNHHHQSFTIRAGIKVVPLVPCIFKSIPQVLEVQPERSKWTSFVAKMSPREREMKRSINYNCQEGRFREYLHLANVTNITNKYRVLPKNIDFNWIVCYGGVLWELD